MFTNALKIQKKSNFRRQLSIIIIIKIFYNIGQQYNGPCHCMTFETASPSLLSINTIFEPKRVSLLYKTGNCTLVKLCNFSTHFPSHWCAASTLTQKSGVYQKRSVELFYFTLCVHHNCTLLCYYKKHNS